MRPTSLASVTLLLVLMSHYRARERRTIAPIHQHHVCTCSMYINVEDLLRKVDACVFLRQHTKDLFSISSFLLKANHSQRGWSRSSSRSTCRIKMRIEELILDGKKIVTIVVR